MSPLQPRMLDRLSKGPASPALRQIRDMMKDPHTETLRQSTQQSVQEVLSVWSIRLWNATLRGRRFVGLADLVRALLKLSPDVEVEQIALHSGSKTGLVFFVANTDNVIGAVVTVQTEQEGRKSYRNWEVANGMPFPSLASGSSRR